MFWFHVYLVRSYYGTFYAPDSEEAVKECMVRNKKEKCSIALVTWIDSEKKVQSREYLDCQLFGDVHLCHKGE